MSGNYSLCFKFAGIRKHKIDFTEINQLQHTVHLSATFGLKFSVFRLERAVVKLKMDIF